jgi:catechol 2,3-dioxygenase-like lactoylglutathione lyase family enzyme
MIIGLNLPNYSRLGKRDSVAAIAAAAEAGDAGGVRNNGVPDDTLTGARYIAFYDPDGIAWELYATPASSATENSIGGMA